MPKNQPINASITASVPRRDNPQNITTTCRMFVMVKALMSIVIAIASQFHPTSKRGRAPLFA